MYKKIFSFITIGLLLSSCEFNDINAGSFYMSVKFPEKKFSTKAVPEQTSSILVRVDGAGIESAKPITFELTKENNTKMLKMIPTGLKSINVTAINSDSLVLATGSSTVDVKEKIVNRVEIELKALPVPEPIEEPCLISFPATENISESLKKSIENAGCNFEIK